MALGHVVLWGFAIVGGLARGSDAPGEIVVGTLTRARPALHRCWERAAADDYRLEGVVVVRATLDPAGAVTATTLVSDGPGDRVLSGCVVELARGLRFAGLGVDELEVPFEFVAPAAQWTVRAEDAPPRATQGQEVRALLTEASVAAHDLSLARFDLLPGNEFSVGGLGERALVVVLAGGLDSPQGRLSVGDAVSVTGHRYVGRARGRTQLLGLLLPRPATPSAPRVASKKTRAPHAIGSGKGSVRILFDEELAGDPAAYAGLFSARAGMTAAPHTHDASTEVLYVTKGGGTMTISGERVPVEAGMAVHIPKGTVHAFVAGPQGLEAVQFYAPAGPEQRFKAGPHGPTSPIPAPPVKDSP